MQTQHLSSAELTMLNRMYRDEPVPPMVLRIADRAKGLYEQVSSVNLTKSELVTIAAIAEQLDFNDPPIIAVSNEDPDDGGAGDGSGVSGDDDPPGSCGGGGSDGSPVAATKARRNRK